MAQRFSNPDLKYLVAFYCALIYVALLMSLFVWALVCFVRNEWPVLWPLKALRAMGGLSATTLFIPLFYLLMSGYNCGDGEAAASHWSAAGIACASGGFIFQASVTTLLLVGCALSGWGYHPRISTPRCFDLVAVVAVAGLFTLVVFDSNPMSVNPSAKAHGRADLAFLICKAGGDMSPPHRYSAQYRILRRHADRARRPRGSLAKFFLALDSRRCLARSRRRLD